MMYTFSIDHVPGEHLYTALSRAPVKHTGDQQTKEFRQEVDNYVNAVMLYLTASDQRLEQIRQRRRAKTRPPLRLKWMVRRQAKNTRTFREILAGKRQPVSQ